jgi:hypothetical protein
MMVKYVEKDNFGLNLGVFFSRKSSFKLFKIYPTNFLVLII